MPCTLQLGVFSGWANKQGLHNPHHTLQHFSPKAHDTSRPPHFSKTSTSPPSQNDLKLLTTPPRRHRGARFPSISIITSNCSQFRANSHLLPFYSQRTFNSSTKKQKKNIPSSTFHSFRTRQIDSPSWVSESSRIINWSMSQAQLP